MSGSKRVITAVLLLAALLAAGFYFVNARRSSAQQASSGVLSKAKFTVDSANVDLGNIERGDTAEYTYTIRNTGTDILTIDSMKASCGCTTPSLDLNRVPPAGLAHIKVVFNSSNREFGPFGKTISMKTNTVGNRETLHFHGVVVIPKQPHKNAMSVQGIFSGACAECHVNKGQGQIGESLYAADCAICHGDKSDNKPGPNLLTQKKKLDQTYLFQTIQNGIPHTNMPAFDWARGGPLKAQEITTLCEYIVAEHAPSNHRKP